jgi:inhibitor of KinA
VPAYASLAVFFFVSIVKDNYATATTAFEFVKTFAEKLINEINTTAVIAKRKIITIPVYYNGDDLAYVAEQHGLSVEEVISIHTERHYRVYMIGFLPGFAYMGKLDERIATARHSSPRTNVKPGSVGIAGFQTGIYPLDSPGGWQLIGQTALKIFDRQKNKPCLLQAGDMIQFISISKENFESSNEY